jgi:hypothetical protein
MLLTPPMLKFEKILKEYGKNVKKPTFCEEKCYS